MSLRVGHLGGTTASSGTTLEEARRISEATVETARSSLDTFTGTPNKQNIDASLLDRVLETAVDRTRAELTASIVRKNFSLDDKTFGHAAVLIWASSVGRDEPGTEGLVTPVQAVTALRALAQLEPEAKATVTHLLASAGSAGEHAVLLKTLGARAHRVGDVSVIEDLREVAELIRAQSLEWMIENTTAYGIRRQFRDHGPEGIQKFDVSGCGAGVQLLAEAEVDPLLALRVNLDPRGLLDPESFAVKRQREHLLDAGGAPVAKRLIDRFKLGELLRRSKGGQLSDYMTHVLDSTGAQYKGVDAKTEGRTESFLINLERAVMAGYDIPLRTRREGYSSEHAEIIVDVSQHNGMRAWRVHDVETGRTRWLGDAALRGEDRREGWMPVALYVPF